MHRVVAGVAQLAERPSCKRQASGSNPLTGDHADVVVEPGSAPHLWAVGHGLVVTIAGDLSVAELIHTAESLQPWK